MTIAEKLFEIGVKCPSCGGSVTCVGRLHNRFQMVCHCGATGGFPLEVGMRAALTSWLVLTGGPIPWSIEPPTHDAPRLTSDCGKTYFLAPHQRTPEIIRPWLEEEI